MDDSQNNPKADQHSTSASSVVDLVAAVLRKLDKFNPGVSYQREDIKQTVRSVIKSGKVDGIVLMPDQNRFNTIPIESDKYKLLVAHCCKVYVDLIVQPRFVHPHLKQKRIPKHQKEFAFELENEIYQLENGDAAFGA